MMHHRLRPWMNREPFLSYFRTLQQHKHLYKHCKRTYTRLRVSDPYDFGTEEVAWHIEQINWMILGIFGDAFGSASSGREKMNNHRRWDWTVASRAMSPLCSNLIRLSNLWTTNQSQVSSHCDLHEFVLELGTWPWSRYFVESGFRFDNAQCLDLDMKYMC